MVEQKVDVSPERFRDYTDDEMTKVRLSYEGYVVPFFLLVLWLATFVFIVYYVLTYAVPDAMLWLGG